MTPRGAALRARMQVDGTWLATADVMRSPELPALLTYEGPLPDMRYPQRPSATMRTAASVSDPAHLRGIRAHLVAKRPIRSEVRTRARARFILELLRTTLGPRGIMGWSEARDNRPGYAARSAQFDGWRASAGKTVGSHGCLAESSDH